MKTNKKIVTLFGATIALTFCGVSAVTEATPTTSVQTVEAATLTIPKSKGYTSSRVLKANTGKLSKSNKKKLVEGSIAGMKENDWIDTDSSDIARKVDVTNLSESDKVMLTHFTLDLINQARRQMGKKAWTYKKGALKFADRTAQQYYNNNRSVWDADHYVAGIERAAKQSGLNYKAGQVYEDESGLPITTEFNGHTRSIAALKNQIYFNVKQMLFGGFSSVGSGDPKKQYDNASRYVEWEHAGDLLGLRSAQGYDAKTKYFGVSFSGLKNDSSKISVHMMGVAKRYILNYKKFNK
ncbi:SEC10/PgrA surface exclusion domain-containing protein [Lactobacillus agrestimuris]|uniref:SEC10/PgrA surface exclusion domain-containing protein n=1 Tax=Lactobacillus agrestimuris TaxID=2941328 RepID=UPI00199F94F1|nr:SEC10/PgrA surface exclusion domain-containing protein [Lactobacillus agrestimuris]MBD5431599.1 SEC10/PgrA surface exclusion domain-containing protein [Lactobacillus sp.]